MNKFTKIVTSFVIVLVLFVVTFELAKQNNQALGSTYDTNPTFAVASSTVFTLTTTSQRLLATTTTPKRYAVTIQPTNCTSTIGTVFMSMGTDIPATSGTGLAAFGTSTLALSSYPNIPVIQNSVQGIVNTGTCTVLVTEWRTLQ